MRSLIHIGRPDDLMNQTYCWRPVRGFPNTSRTVPVKAVLHEMVVLTNLSGLNVCRDCREKYIAEYQERVRRLAAKIKWQRSGCLNPVKDK